MNVKTLHIVVTLMFVGSFSFAQLDNWFPMCDTITGEQVYVQQTELADDCCYRWDGSNWTKRDCNNLRSKCHIFSISESQYCYDSDSDGLYDALALIRSQSNGSFDYITQDGDILSLNQRGCCQCKPKRNAYIIPNDPNWIDGGNMKYTLEGLTRYARNFVRCRTLDHLRYYGYVYHQGVEYEWESGNYTPETTQSEMYQIIVDGLNSSDSGVLFSVDETGTLPRIRSDFNNSQEFGYVVQEIISCDDIETETKIGWSTGRASDGKLFECFNANSPAPYFNGDCDGNVEYGEY